MDKIIVRHTAGKVTYGNAYIIPNNYSHTLSAFNDLAEIARKDWKMIIDDGDIHFGTIINSSSHQGMPVLQFSFDPAKPNPEGWRELKRFPHNRA